MNFFETLWTSVKTAFVELFSNWVYIVILAVAIVGLILFLSFRKKGEKVKSLSTRTIVYGAISIALAVVLNLFTIFSMPNGGSVTLCRVLPLLVFAYAFGAPKGFLIGAIYGVIDCFAKPYVIHPVQFLLDYPLAFATVGFAGIFAKFKNMRKINFVLGAVIFAFARFTFSTISGMVYYGLPLGGSMAYNSVLLIDAAIAIAVVVLLQFSKSFNHLVDNIQMAALKKN